jgi:hypothetical protein
MLLPVLAMAAESSCDGSYLTRAKMSLYRATRSVWISIILVQLKQTVQRGAPDLDRASENVQGTAEYESG